MLHSLVLNVVRIGGLVGKSVDDFRMCDYVNDIEKGCLRQTLVLFTVEQVNFPL